MGSLYITVRSKDIIDEFVCFVVFSNGTTTSVNNKKMKKASKTDSKKYHNVCKKLLQEYRRDLYKYPSARLDGDHNAFKDYPHKPPPKFTKKY